MDEITSLLLWQDDGLYFESGFNDLVIKIEKTEEEFEDAASRNHMLYTASIDLYDASEVPLSVYRRWKSEDNVEIVEVDADKANENLLSLTGKEEQIRKFVEQQVVDNQE